MYKRDEHFARCLEEDGPWIEEAKAAKQAILEAYEKQEPMSRIPVGYQQIWKMQHGRDIILESMPKFCKWLDDNDAEVNYWTVNVPRYKTIDLWTAEEVIEMGLPKELADPKIQKGLTVHTDMACPIDQMETFKNGGPYPPINFFTEEEREGRHAFPSISINIPLDENSGMEEIEVYDWGDPPVTEKPLTEVIGMEGPKHGCFDIDELVSRSLIEDSGKKVVMLNILQPHRWSKSNATPATRLLVRVTKKLTPRVDPWWLFEAVV